MITYINMLLIALLATVNISCEKKAKMQSDSFFYGTWNEVTQNQDALIFYYAEGFELFEDGKAYPRYDYENEGKYVTNSDYLGNWSYDHDTNKLDFKSEGSISVSEYNVEILSDNKIKLTNPNTGNELMYQRE